MKLFESLHLTRNHLPCRVAGVALSSLAIVGLAGCGSSLTWDSKEPRIELSAPTPSATKLPSTSPVSAPSLQFLADGAFIFDDGAEGKCLRAFLFCMDSSKNWDTAAKDPLIAKPGHDLMMVGMSDNQRYLPGSQMLSLQFDAKACSNKRLDDTPAEREYVLSTAGL